MVFGKAAESKKNIVLRHFTSELRGKLTKVLPKESGDNISFEDEPSSSEDLSGGAKVVFAAAAENLHHTNVSSVKLLSDESIEIVSSSNGQPTSENPVFHDDRFHL